MIWVQSFISTCWIYWGWCCGGETEGQNADQLTNNTKKERRLQWPDIQNTLVWRTLTGAWFNPRYLWNNRDQTRLWSKWCLLKPSNVLLHPTVVFSIGIPKRNTCMLKRTYTWFKTDLEYFILCQLCLPIMHQQLFLSCFICRKHIMKYPDYVNKSKYFSRTKIGSLKKNIWKFSIF